MESQDTAKVSTRSGKRKFLLPAEQPSDDLPDTGRSQKSEPLPKRIRTKEPLPASSPSRTPDGHPVDYRLPTPAVVANDYSGPNANGKRVDNTPVPDSTTSVSPGQMLFGWAPAQTILGSSKRQKVDFSVHCPKKYSLPSPPLRSDNASLKFMFKFPFFRASPISAADLPSSPSNPASCIQSSEAFDHESNSGISSVQDQPCRSTNGPLNPDGSFVSQSSFLGTAVNNKDAPNGNENPGDYEEKEEENFIMDYLNPGDDMEVDVEGAKGYINDDGSHKLDASRKTSVPQFDCDKASNKGSSPGSAGICPGSSVQLSTLLPLWANSNGYDTSFASLSDPKDCEKGKEKEGVHVDAHPTDAVDKDWLAGPSPSLGTSLSSPYTKRNEKVHVDTNLTDPPLVDMKEVIDDDDWLAGPSPNLGTPLSSPHGNGKEKEKVHVNANLTGSPQTKHPPCVDMQEVVDEDLLTGPSPHLDAPLFSPREKGKEKEKAHVDANLTDAPRKKHPPHEPVEEVVEDGSSAGPIVEDGSSAGPSPNLHAPLSSPHGKGKEKVHVNANLTGAPRKKHPPRVDMQEVVDEDLLPGPSLNLDTPLSSPHGKGKEKVGAHVDANLTDAPRKKHPPHEPVEEVVEDGSSAGPSTKPDPRPRSSGNMVPNPTESSAPNWMDVDSDDPSVSSLTDPENVHVGHIYKELKELIWSQVRPSSMQNHFRTLLKAPNPDYPEIWRGVYLYIAVTHSIEPIGALPKPNNDSPKPPKPAQPMPKRWRRTKHQPGARVSLSKSVCMETRELMRSTLIKDKIIFVEDKDKIISVDLWKVNDWKAGRHAGPTTDSFYLELASTGTWTPIAVALFKYPQYLLWRL
ncbi:hypothetical protein BDP27DRAFT_1433701 [Rhodocollybia butyracea]|uniref:Uncharacterized protein n=1 Tax=Rhodocollybia butyracea TaxID=206335 RepID=A0A9P5TWP2_9AGAR|nr:hypothetical protein BDP27DRAFT_1433701 [Rhodocollybia butyracea]